MGKLIALLMILPSLAFAGTVDFCGQVLTYNDKLSFGNVTDWQNLSSKDLNGQVIYAISIPASTPDTHIFPEDMTGVTFANCDIDDVFLPPGNQVITCDHNAPQRIMTINGCDWIVDKNNLPVQQIDPTCGIITVVPPPSTCPC